MANADPTMVRCATCGTEFDSTDAAAASQHAGHTLEHIEQT
jgi:hypothetical protein